ncbi:MAG TPA: Gfo/Idh/MocA family oxidoreductase [Chthoniobacteraceae bacterium]|nr:Gfo/Idh/MocA family oxidoreductase [Chthoniobacteraceae bacterium]
MIQIGLIGCGWLGRTHCRMIARIPGATVTAYADRRPEAAHALLDEFGGSYATDDADRLLADPALNAIYIVTRHDSHAPLCLAAIEAGKHVLLEKPIAMDLAQAEAIARAAADSPLLVMPAFKMRFYPLVQKAKAFLPKPQVIVAQMMDNRWADDFWAQDPVEGGGNVFSQGCHTTDLLRYFAGSEPTRLWASGGSLTHPGHPCPDQCLATLEFANGCRAAWVQGDAGLGHHTSKLFFGLHADGRSVQLSDRLKRATFSDGEQVWTETCEEEEGYFLENVEFISALEECRKPGLTLHDGLQATRVVFSALEAMRSGEVQLLLDPKAQPGL